MTEEKKLYEYTCLEAIRRLSGIFSEKDAVDRLAIICLIVRGMQGDAEVDYVKEVLEEVGIKLTDLGEKDGQEDDQAGDPKNTSREGC